MAEPQNIKNDQIKTVSCPIVNVHGSLDETPEDNISESQQLVICNKDPTISMIGKKQEHMPLSQSFLYFNKIAQIPLLSH